MRNYDNEIRALNDNIQKLVLKIQEQDENIKDIDATLITFKDLHPEIEWEKSNELLKAVMPKVENQLIPAENKVEDKFDGEDYLGIPII